MEKSKNKIFYPVKNKFLSGANGVKKIFIVWGRETKLSQYLAQALNAEIRQIYYKKIGQFNLPTVFRYLFQAMETLLVLFHDKPSLVIVQNPPVFAPLTVMLYCKLTGAKFAIDSHTAAFLDKKWIAFYPFFKFAARRASLNSCHNFKNLEILKNWGIEPAMVMQFANPKYDLLKLDLPMKNKKIEAVLAQSKLPIIMVNRFAGDDDYETVIAAAKLMPEADFFITGDPTEAGTNFNSLPPNVFLTGYLPHEEFLKLMRRARVVLAFTLRRDTVLWSIRESLALGKPFITTDSEVLRHYFGQIGLFVESRQPEKLKEQIFEAMARENENEIKIKIYLEKDELRWRDEIALYKKYLN